MNYKGCVILAIFYVSTFMACKKVPVKSGPLPPHDTTVITKDTVPKPRVADVYITGDLTLGPGRWIAVYWKNDTLKRLVTDTTVSSSAGSTVIYGSDVYIAGFTTDVATSNTVATYWKNGVPTKLTNGETRANASAILVSGTDVYVTGGIWNSKGENKAVYWKNGIINQLTDGNGISVAGAIAKLGEDIYITGFSTIDDRHTEGILWKNGTAMLHGTEYSFSDVVTNSTDIYVSGGLNGNATYWKNGVPQLIPGGNHSAGGIFLAGNDLYIAGATGGFGINRPSAYWKNNVKVPLGEGGNDTGAIAVNGNDVYVIGSQVEGQGAYWKNGGFVLTPGGTGTSLNGIALLFH